MKYRNYTNKVRSYSPWSHEEDAALLRLYSRGFSRRTIAAEIGRSHNAICSRLSKKYSIYINHKPLPVVPRTTIDRADVLTW